MMTITPTEECVSLYLSDRRQRNRKAGHAQNVVVRWLERMAARKGRHINKPSVLLEIEHDAATRRTFLLAYADSFPDTMPGWLRTTRISKAEVIFDGW